MQDPDPPSSADAPDDQPPPEPSGAAKTGVRPRRRPPWKLWLSILAILVALRIASGIVLGPMIEERLSRMLGTHVDVGDVSFEPIDAIITLRKVTVHAPGATSSEDPPAIEAARVHIDLQWLPLLHRSLLVRELALESARIDLARFAGSGSSIESLLRVDPTSELPPAWTFALDRVVLRDSRIRLRELGDGDAEPIEVGVRDAQVSTLRRRASVFGRAPNLRVDALVEGGRLRVDGTSDLRDDGVVVDALVRVKDVPLARLHPYLADLGWTAVSGRVSGQLHYQRDPGRRDLLTGRLQARRIAVQVPALEEPAFAVRRAVAEIDAIDLRQHRVALGSLTLHGARLAVRPDVSAPLPLLDGVTLAAPPPVKHRRPAPAAARVTPWSWTIGHVATPFARLHVAGADGPVVLAASVAGESLGPGAYWSPVRAWIGRGGGVAVFDGTARLTRGLVLDGRLTATDVDLPAFARALGTPLADLAQAGRGAADLTVEVEPGATKEPTLDVRGHVTLSDLWLAGPAADAFALGASSVEMRVAGIDPGREDATTFVPTRVRIADAVISAPYAILTRTPEGWLLPPFLPEGEVPLDVAAVDGATGATTGAEDGPAPGTVVAGGGAIAPVAAKTDGTARDRPNVDVIAPGAAPTLAAATIDPALAEVEPPAPPPRTEVVFSTLRTNGGRLLVVDDATVPSYVFDVALVEGWVHELRLPQATVASFVTQGIEPRFGVLQVAGSRSYDRREIDLSAQGVPLAATTPYLEQAGLPYRFIGGTGSFLAHVAFAGGRWSADSTLTLREPRLTGDEMLLRQSFGMPTEAALASLRDRDGVVTLQLPLASTTSDDPRALPDMVAGAVRAAVARARQTPLPDAPIQIAFPAGRAELSVQAARQLASIAELLGQRRDVVVELGGAVSTADRRWFEEQELVADLEEPGGFMGILRALGVRDQRERIRYALEQRGEGRPGRLDADDEAVVDRLITEGPPVSEGRLAALAAARLTRITNVLTIDHAIAPARVLIADPSGRESGTTPSVRARINVDPRAPNLVTLGTPR